MRRLYFSDEKNKIDHRSACRRCVSSWHRRILSARRFRHHVFTTSFSADFKYYSAALFLAFSFIKNFAAATALSYDIISYHRKPTDGPNGWLIRRSIVDENHDDRTKKKMTKDPRSSRRSFYCHKLHNKCLAKMWISWAHLLVPQCVPNVRLSERSNPLHRQLVLFLHWILSCWLVGVLVLDFSWHSSHARHVVLPVFMTICEHAVRVQNSQTLAQGKSPRSNLFFFCRFSRCLDSISLLCFSSDAKMQSKHSNNVQWSRQRRRRCERERTVALALSEQSLVDFTKENLKKKKKRRPKTGRKQRFIKWFCKRHGQQQPLADNH